MNRSGDELNPKHTDAVEALLQQAAPRPVPPEADEKRIRDAVRGEWKAMARQRKARTRYVTAGIAAAVLLAVAAGFNALRVTGIAPVAVATIVKSHGSIYVRGGDGNATAEPENVVVAGQTINTGSAAAAGLEWMSGGSLRLDKNTRIEFVASTEVYLHTGRVYFDSGESDSVLSIATPHGRVTNTGTQFMTSSDSRALTVSVRDGEVRIDGRYHDATAHDGQELVFAGSARPVPTNIRGTESEWQWVEEVASDFQAGDAVIAEFLEWVARETGHTVEYVSPAAEQLAMTERLVGDLQGSPRSQLMLRMETAGVEAAFDTGRGVLVVGTEP